MESNFDFALDESMVVNTEVVLKTKVHHENKQNKVSSQKIQISKNSLYEITKRAVDIIGSSVALLLLSPILLGVAVLIKIEDPNGSVLYKQERVGLNGKLFGMYKFRSMIPNADELIEKLKSHNEMDGPVFKMTNDPRVTKIGAFIRKTSIDELPQLINILKGEMTVVGPRPALPREVIEYTPYQKQRLLVKQGLTCIWQVSGRNNITFDEWIEMDLKYIRNRSLLLDIQLILKTIKVLFGDKNAK